MPDTSELEGAAFNCEGGLVKNRSTFLMQPGEALVLENFEPDTEGGYRRINGHRKHVNQIIPQTSSSGEKVLMVANFANKILASRGEKIFSSASTDLASTVSSSTSMSGSGTLSVERVSGFSTSGTLQIEDEIFTYTGVNAATSPQQFTGVTRGVTSTNVVEHVVGLVVSQTWTELDSGRTNAGKYRYERFNFNGTDKIIFVDEVNAPVVIDSAMNVVDVSTSSVAGSKFVASFANRIFYAGKSTTPEELVFSVGFDEDSFDASASDPSGSIRVDDTITGIKVFRNDLFIFCENRIFKLTGSALADFAIEPVTRNIGCINGDTIQEFAGDLIFLGPDGLRTIAATARIGDTELGTISRNVQSIFDANIKDASLFESVVIADKTQYRMFFTKKEQSSSQTKGIICVMKPEQFEFSEIRGIKPSATDTFVETGQTIVLHGDFEGFVHRQEVGNTFDGTAILGKYRTPDLGFGDTGIRKHMQRIIVNYKPESSIDADLLLRYDNESADSTRPDAYPLDTTDVAALFGLSSFSTAASKVQFIFGGPSQPLVRQSVEGSGFSVVMRIHDGGETAPYSIKGFQLEYQLVARR